MIDYALKLLPVVVIFVAWAIRLEIRLTRLETHMLWIRGEIPKCQPSSETPTH